VEASSSSHIAVKRFLTVFLLLASVAITHVAWSADAGRRVWVGTYTEGTKSQGIYTTVFDEQTGALPALTVAAETPNPSFLALHPNGKFLYAVNETHDGPEHSGLVTAYAIDAATGALTELNHQLSRGADPCHLAIDATGRFLVVANYSAGNFAEFPIGADGRLGPSMALLVHKGSGPNKERQEGPHAHDVVFSPDNRHLIAVDLGLDQVFVYTFDPASGDIKPVPQQSAATAAGAGPRHFAFHPGGRSAFSINELSSTITSYAWNGSTGALTRGASVSTLPANFQGTNSTAEIAIDAAGSFVYGSNRGHDSIAVFAVTPSGALSLVEHTPTGGKTPRNFAIDPAGRWLVAANQESSTLTVFRRDATSGRLTAAGMPHDVPAPVCVLFRP
jgi:6-phosphogluconolactonase